MKKLRTGLAVLTVLGLWCGRSLAEPLRVVTTLPDYAVVAQSIAGEHAEVSAIVRGEQDAHFIRPKPSFVDQVRGADVLVDTGLDMEMWLPTVVNKSGNGRVRSGQPGYVAAASGMRLLEKPRVLSRSEGGLHVYGNPHVTCSPINMKVAARNITTGLMKNDPANTASYKANLKLFCSEIDERLFGAALVEMLGGDTLCELAEEGKLMNFLNGQEYEGRPLTEYLGGWMEVMLPLRGTPIVTHHRNWVYFLDLFGLEEAGTVEPKPGIPPSPRHVLGLTEMMRERGVRIILAANYFDEQKVRTVAARAESEPVIVPLYVGGENGITNYFQLVDHWTSSLLNAARKQGVTE